MTNEQETPRINSGPVLVGLILTFVGLAMLADRTGISGGLHLAGKFWPFVMIAFGVTRLIAPSEPRTGHNHGCSGLHAHGKTSSILRQSFWADAHFAVQSGG